MLSWDKIGAHLIMIKEQKAGALDLNGGIKMGDTIKQEWRMRRREIRGSKIKYFDKIS